MRCQRAQQRLMAYHDSEISPGARRRLEKHLESCAECSQLLERLQLADHHASSAAGVNDMVGVPGMPPQDDRYWESFTARVLDRVEEDAATRAPDRHKPRRKWDLFIPRMAPAFSIALVVVIAAGVLMKIGDPMPVPQAPVVLTDVASEKGVLVTGKESRDEPDRGEREYYADTPGGESPRASAEETRDNDGAYRSTPAPVSQPEKIVLLRKMEESTLALRKRAALAAPEVEVVNEWEDTDAASGPKTKEVLSTKVEAEKPLRSAPEKIHGDDIVLGEVVKAAPEALLEARLDQAGISPEVAPDSSIARAEMPQLEVEPSTVPMAGDADLDTSEGKDDRVQEKAAVSPAEAASPSVTADSEMDNNVMVQDSAPTTAGREEAASGFSDESVRTLEEPKEPGDDVALLTTDKPSGESKLVASGMKTLDSSIPSEDARQTFASRAPLYRGPEDQLTHARSLAEVRKFWESEQVLKDLLSQRPPSPIQEEASVLLVKVLSGQNRIREAQQVLDDAREQYPASEMIQTFDLKQEGE